MSTTPKGAQSNDPFWDSAAQMLLLALIFYLKYEAPEDEQNFSMVMEMLRAGAITDEDGGDYTPLDDCSQGSNRKIRSTLLSGTIMDYHSGILQRPSSPSRLLWQQDLRSSTLKISDHLL